MDEKNNNLGTSLHSRGVHRILAHSYTFYFLLFILGFFLDIIFPIKIFESVIIRYIGFLVLLFATGLIFWAQRTSRNLDNSNLTKESFYQGPYRFTRGPTHFGLFLLIIGFGMVANTIFVIFFTVIAFFVTKLVFLKEQEILLEEKYGEPYREYKKTVRF